MSNKQSITPNNALILKNSIFLYIRLIVVMVVTLYTTRVLISALGVADYGLYNVVCGFVTMFGFLNSSMSNGVQRYYNYLFGIEGDVGITKVYNVSIRIQCFILILALIATETIGLWYINYMMVIPDDKLLAANCIYQFSILSFLLVIIQVPFSAVIIAYERINFTALVGIIDVIFKLLIAFAVKHVHINAIVWYGFLIFLVHFAVAAIYYTYCKKNFNTLKYKRYYDRNLMKEMFKFSGWNVFGSFAYIIKGQGINLLLNNFFGTIINAANAITTQVTSAIQLFSSNLAMAFRPQLTQSYAVGDYLRTEKLMFSMSRLSFYLFCIIAVPIYINIDNILSIWIGPTTPEPTSIFIRLSIISTGIGVLNLPLSQVVHATGRNGQYEFITSMIICSILPISWISLKLGANPETVFVVMAIICGLNQCVCMYTLNRIFKYNVKHYLSKVILRCCLFVSISFIIGLLMYSIVDNGFIKFS